MKSFILIASLLVGSLGQAQNRYFCREMQGKKTVVIVTEGKELSVRESESLDARHQGEIEIFNSDLTTSDIYEKGIIETEDVMFNFMSIDKKISLDFYADEMSDATLNVNGNRIRLVCY